MKAYRPHDLTTGQLEPLGTVAGHQDETYEDPYYKEWKKILTDSDISEDTLR